MSKAKLIVKLYRTLQAREQCKKEGNSWFDNHTRTLHEYEQKYLPSGSGIDSGCKIDMNHCSNKRIVISFGYHHMNEGGFYDGWTIHAIICTPSFDGFNMRITGKDKNGIKDYLYETFDYALNTEIE